ncbi:hypothetical protein JCM16303_000425 [Sporobolomyces ruberrimus]
MLNHLLNTRYTSNSPPLVVLSDSLLQPGLSLFHQLISSSPPSTHTILLCIDQPPTTASLPQLDHDRLHVIDCTIDQDFPRPSSSSTSLSSPITASIDVSLPRVQQELERELVEAVKKAKVNERGPVQIAIDGINSLADALGTEGVWRLIKKGLKVLEGLPLGSRLLLVHHDYFPSLPASTSATSQSPSLLASLLSSLLSPSTIHLTVHPTSHFHTLSLKYSLTLPSLSSPLEDPDLRTIEFLTRLRERGVGDPFRRPERSDEEDERVALDALGSIGGEGKAVLGWNCRGVTVGKVSRISQGGNLNGGGGGGGEKKVVTWGFDGVRRKSDESGLVKETELGNVLDPRQMRKSREENSHSEQIISSTSTSSATASSRPNPTTSSSSSTSSTSLPFSLTLTPSQLAARSLVANPYEGHNKPIFGEAGYTGQVDDTKGSGGFKVEYTADRGDDLDEEEPDEDLEI